MPVSILPRIVVVVVVAVVVAVVAVDVVVQCDGENLWRIGRAVDRPSVRREKGRL